MASEKILPPVLLRPSASCWRRGRCPLNRVSREAATVVVRTPASASSSARSNLIDDSRAAASDTASAPGRVLSPPPANSDWWDKKYLAGPIVIPGGTLGPSQSTSEIPASKWRMYYYGRDSDNYAKGVKGGPSPFGKVGLALSDDGIQWERFRGPLEGGAIFLPAEADSAFDCVQVSSTQILPPGSVSCDAYPYKDKWVMWYFGEGLEKPQVAAPGSGYKSGVAVSDDGIHFERLPGHILPNGAPGEPDYVSAVFNRVIPPDAANPFWYMHYHSFGEEDMGNGQKAGRFYACVALSSDGVTWEKKGKVLSGGGPGSWDEGGVGYRDVLRIDGKYYMLYSGVNTKFKYAVGLATSEDGLSWEKVQPVGMEPGGPVLQGDSGVSDWDKSLVATPFLLERPNGDLWMYYYGASFGENFAISPGIGLAVCKTRDFVAWERMGV